MNSNKKYLHFYILKCGLKDGKESLDIVDNNLTYREALKSFKRLRLELEATSKEFMHIILMGVTTENSEVIVKTKEIAPKEEFLQKNVRFKDEINDIIEESNDKDDLTLNNKTTLDNEIMIDNTLDEDLKEEDKIEFNDYIDELTRSVKEIEEDTSCNTLSDDSTNILDLNNFEERLYKDILNEKKTLKSLNLKDYYRHIADVDSIDIVKLIIDAFKILDEKHNYNSDMINLLTKRRDCYCHDFENLDKMNFASIEEQNKFILSLGANMHNTGLERRKFKNEYSITEKVFKSLPRVRQSYYNPLVEIQKSMPKFNIDKAVNIKTYVYNYNTEEERTSLLKELTKKFDKVVDVEWGKFECYNKVGSSCNKKVDKDIISEIEDKIDLIDELSAKSYEAIVNETVKCGTTFLKTKGTSVKITNVDKKAASHLTKTIHHKYSKCAYDLKSKSLYLIKRL